MAMKESGEMYLETILVLSKQKSYVRAIDIAEEMGYSKPSVSRAMKLLKGKEYIEIDEQGAITLTPAGRKIARAIYDRHSVLSTFLMHLGVDEKTAVDDACRLEHYISDTSFNALKKYIKKHPDL